MNPLIIGCRTLENELNRAIAECGCTYDIKWVESGLHNVPKKLMAALQSIIDTSSDYTHALFSMGYCGNSLSGLNSQNLTLIIPRFDDCISLLLGSNKAKKENLGTYYMTEGWLKGERNIWVEYEYAVGKYGKEQGEEIFRMMLGHYQFLAMLDTGCFDLTQAGQEARMISDTLHLEYMTIPATIEMIKRLLSCPWDDSQFLHIPPQSVISDTQLTLTDY